MKNKTKRIIFGILILINCLTIFWFSHQVSDDSGEQSGRVVNFISNIVPYIRDMEEPDKTIFKEEILSPIVRKTAHFSIYAMLGFLTINFVLSFRNKEKILDDENITFKNKKIYKEIIASLLFCFVYAMSDEFHQSFIPGRSCEFRDVLIDTSGALVGILGILTLYISIRKIRKPNKVEGK